MLILIFVAVLFVRFLSWNEGAWLCEGGAWIKHGNPSSPMPKTVCGDNEKKAIKSFEECAAAGNPVMESYPRQCRAQSGEAFTEDIGNELDKSNLIKVNNPRPDQAIQSPLVVEGEARGSWYFEASFPVKLLDANGKELAITPAQAQGDWMTEEFVPFKAELKFEPPATEAGFFVLEKDNPSGLPQYDDELRIPVKFEKAVETTKVKIFFNNNMMDPAISCDKVFPVEREVAKTEVVARAALTELLKGATEEEEGNEFYSNINSGVKIEGLTIENGTARVDFDEQLESGVAGSCRVTAIRSQITETLKQFSTVNDVIISINGRTEDILQP